MKRNILTIIFCKAGSAAICWLCDWKTKAIAWMLIFWVVIAVGVAGATLSDYIETHNRYLPQYWERLKDLQSEIDRPMKKFCNKKYGNYGNVFDMEKVFEQSKQDA